MERGITISYTSPRSTLCGCLTIEATRRRLAGCRSAWRLGLSCLRERAARGRAAAASDPTAAPVIRRRQHEDSSRCGRRRLASPDRQGRCRSPCVLRCSCCDRWAPRRIYLFRRFKWMDYLDKSRPIRPEHADLLGKSLSSRANDADTARDSEGFDLAAPQAGTDRGLRHGLMSCGIYAKRLSYRSASLRALNQSSRRPTMSTMR
jgi:hypothetical protein